MESISTPERVETHLGTLEIPLGVPTEETANRVYDHLDRLHAVRSFLDAYSGVSMWAARKGFLEAGIKDHDVLLFSEFMDPETLVLTGNADTVYFVTFLDLTEGPLVVDVPPVSLCFLNDLWYRWVADPGMAGPDRGPAAGTSSCRPAMRVRFRKAATSPGGPAPRGSSSSAGGRSWRTTTPSRRSSASRRACASTATSPATTGRASGRSSRAARPRRCPGPRRRGPPRSTGPTRLASSRAAGWP